MKPPRPVSPACHALTAAALWLATAGGASAVSFIEDFDDAALDPALTNRTGVSTVGGLFGHNIVGSGAFVDDDVQEVPEPAAFASFILGLMSLGLATRLHKTY